MDNANGRSGSNLRREIGVQQEINLHQGSGLRPMSDPRQDIGLRQGTYPHQGRGAAPRQVAFYGKGGIGKSTVSQNMAAALASAGRKVMVVGCDPKADCTSMLTGEFLNDTVLEQVRALSRGSRLEEGVDDVVKMGFAGIACIEAGGPEPGVGCAGRGIIAAIDLIKRKGLIDDSLDFVFYDVLGDVVCGGFAMPIRQGFAREIYLVTSGEMMSLYAANNICKGVRRYASSGQARIGGIICNCRNVEREMDLVSGFAKAIGCPVLGVVPRDALVQKAEAHQKTVMEHAPESSQAQAYRKLAQALEDNEMFIVPDPLSREALRDLVLRYGD